MTQSSIRRLWISGPSLARAWILGGMLASSGGLWADTVIFSNGVRMEGDVVGQTPTEVVLRNAQGTLRLPKATIRRIEYTDTKRAEEERLREERLRQEKEREEELRRQKQEEIDRQAAEQRRKAEEDRRAAEERHREEQVAREKARLEKEAAARDRALKRNGIRVGLTLGEAALRPASETLWRNFRKFSNVFSPQYAAVGPSDVRPGAGGGMSLSYVRDRLSLTLEGTGSIHRGTSSEMLLSVDKSGEVFQEFPAFDYRRIVRSSTEARAGFDFWVEERHRFQVFGGYRRDVVTIRGRADGTGTASGGPITGTADYYVRQNITGGSALAGAEAGLGSWHRAGPAELEFRIGGFSGDGTAYYNVTGFTIWQSAGSDRSMSIRSVAGGSGGFASAAVLWPVAPRLDMGVSLSGESLMMRPRTMTFVYGGGMALENLINGKFMNVVMRAQIEEQLRSKDNQAILGLQLRYRLDF